MSNPGAVAYTWYEYRRGWNQREGEVIEETLISLYVNGREFWSLMATPRQQDLLALGFLYNEGLLKSLAEIEVLHLSQAGCCVDIWLNRSITKPPRVIITSGCGGGVTFDDPAVGIEPLESDIEIAPKRLRSAFRRLQPPNSLYARSRGVHAAGLLDADSQQMLVIAEDVGRHNTIDKVAGACLQAQIDPRGKILLSTGRISSEMLRKAARMGCPMVASRTSPTSLSVELARAWNITLVGYVRQGGLRAYSCPERFSSFTQKQKVSEP